METYLTTEQLASRIHYDVRTIRTHLKDAVLLEGVHYIRPFGGRKLLFIWESIQRDIGKFSSSKELLPFKDMRMANAYAIPMANGRVANG